MLNKQSKCYFCADLLNFPGYEVKDMPPDGDCMFNALAHQLFLTKRSADLKPAQTIRLELINFIRSDEAMVDHIQQGLKDGDTVSAYFERMLRAGNWGDGNILSAACKYYHIRILVYNGIDETPMNIECGLDVDCAPITLGYVSQMSGTAANHYVSLIPALYSNEGGERKTVPTKTEDARTGMAA